EARGAVVGVRLTQHVADDRFDGLRLAVAHDAQLHRADRTQYAETAVVELVRRRLRVGRAGAGPRRDPVPRPAPRFVDGVADAMAGAADLETVPLADRSRKLLRFVAADGHGRGRSAAAELLLQPPDKRLLQLGNRLVG